MKEVLTHAEEKMAKTVHVLQEEFSEIRARQSKPQCIG